MGAVDEAAVWDSLRDEVEDKVKEKVSAKIQLDEERYGNSPWTERIRIGRRSRRGGGSTSGGFGTSRFLWRMPAPASSRFFPCVPSMSSTFGSLTPSFRAS